MGTLAEIEAAADQLLPEQQQELLLFLAARLHGMAGPVPASRDLSAKQIEQWIADDEAGQRRFYGLRILAPSEFLISERKAGRLH